MFAFNYCGWFSIYFHFPARVHQSCYIYSYYWSRVKKSQISFSDTGKAHVPFFTLTHTHARTQLFIYTDSCKDILYYYTQVVKIYCTSVHTTHINRTHQRTFHFIYIDSCTDIMSFCTQLVQMDCTSVYTTVHCCTT